MAHRVKIARQACHQIARAVIVIKLHVLMLNLRKQKISNAVEHILRYALKIDAGRIHDNSTQKCYQYHPHNQFDEQFLVGGQIFCRLLAGQEQIHNLFRKDRHRKLQNIVENRPQNAQNIQGAVSLHVLPQPAHLAFTDFHNKPPRCNFILGTVFFTPKLPLRGAAILTSKKSRASANCRSGRTSAAKVLPLPTVFDIIMILGGKYNVFSDKKMGLFFLFRKQAFLQLAHQNRHGRKSQDNPPSLNIKRYNLEDIRKCRYGQNSCLKETAHQKRHHHFYIAKKTDLKK